MLGDVLEVVAAAALTAAAWTEAGKSAGLAAAGVCLFYLAQSYSDWELRRPSWLRWRRKEGDT